MSGKKMLSIILVCSMLVSQPMVEAFAEESMGDVCVAVQTGMTAEAMPMAETETPPLEEGETENFEAEKSVVEEPLEKTEAALNGGDGVEVMTETALTEEVIATEDSVLEIEEENMLTEEAVKEAEEVLSGTCGANLTWKLEDGTLTISGTGAMEDYDFSINNQNLSPWYDSCERINKVIVCNGVTSIGTSAFGGCSSLTSITLSDSVTSIGSRAFGYCTSLTSITLPDSVTSIGSNAFHDCFRLTSIRIPDGVTEISDSMFEFCSGLTSISIPDSVTSIGASVFSCSGLTSISIPDSVTSIGDFAFQDCSNLTSISISDSVTSISPSTFKNCRSLTSIMIPDGVTEIGHSAFQDCSNLTSISIPDSVTYIGGYAFGGCSNLTSITLPASVTGIGEYAFVYCRLTGVYISSIESWCNIEFSTYESNPLNQGYNLYVDLYVNGNLVKDLIIPTSVTEIGNYAFVDCSSLMSIIIPDSVTSIGDYAFSGCSNLTSITIPDRVTSIGDYAFSRCSSVTSITIPDRVTSIGEWAFGRCSSLTNIIIPDRVTSIDNYAFYGCSSLTDVYYGGTEDDWNVISIISDGNEALLSSNIHYNSLSGSAGDNLGWTLDINGVLSINGMGKMADYNYPDSPAPWSEQRDKIKTVIISQGVTSIGTSAFAGCTNLTDITIPKSVVSIGDSAFSDCENLSHVRYLGTKEQLDSIVVGNDNAPFQKASHSWIQPGDVSDGTLQYLNDVYYYDTIAKAGVKTDLTWHWNYLNWNPSTYNCSLAEMGLVLSAAIEGSSSELVDILMAKNGDKTNSLGCDMVEFDATKSPGVAFAHKTVTDASGKTGHVIFVVIRGTTRLIVDGANDILSAVGLGDWGSADVYSELQDYLKKCGKTYGDVKRENTKFFVTGHSLGGACANLVAQKLSDEYGTGNVYAYTFATPSPLKSEVKNNYTNIHNFLCWDDNVPLLLLRADSWYGYGYYTWFYQAESPETEAGYQKLTGKTWQETFEENKFNALKLNPGLGLHAPSIYLAFLQSHPDFEPRKGKFHVYYMRAKCPVDIEVYNSANELVGRIINEEVDPDSRTSGVVLTAVDGLKSAYFAKDDTYTFRITGIGEGTMTFTAASADLNSNIVEEEKIFSNVQIVDGKKMVSRVDLYDETNKDDAVKISDVELLVMNENGDQVAKVLSDQEAVSQGKDKGTEISLDQTDGVIPEDIPADGKIPNGLWIAKVPDVTYTGKAIKPEVHIYDSTRRLKEKKDYTISYKNNVNAYVASSNTAEGMKAPTVTVTGKGNYSGKETAVFNILPVTLNSESTDVLDITLAVGNKVQKPVPVIMVNGKKLANKKDFTLEYPDQSADAYKVSGTYRIKAVGKGNYQGELIIPMAITDKKTISKASVTKIEAQTYTGNPLMPKPVVKYGKDILAEGTGYELEYRDNTEIGTATVLVKGIGDYCGQTRVTFPITGGSISKAKISDSFKMQMEYTGASVTQSCTLTALLGQQTVTLDEGKDYTVKYFDNTKAGKATVVYTGKGAFTGTLKKTYSITPYDIGADSQKKLKYDSSVISAYAKGGSCPVPTITFGNKVLKAGTDFTISYKNNKAVSATGAQMIVKGKGNYKGSITIPFEITTQDLSNLTLTAADGVYQAGKANLYKTALKLTDVDQKALSAGKDYNKETIEYVYVNAVNLENGVHRNAGDKVDPADVIPAETELKVTVYAKEGSNYTGSISAFYRIAKADLKNAKVTVEPQTYNGKQIKPGKDEIKVEMGKTTLSADDYDIVSYGTNTEKGTGTLTIKGKGSYGGIKTVSFKIKTKGFLWWNR